LLPLCCCACFSAAVAAAACIFSFAPTIIACFTFRLHHVLNNCWLSLFAAQRVCVCVSVIVCAIVVVCPSKYAMIFVPPTLLAPLRVCVCVLDTHPHIQRTHIHKLTTSGGSGSRFRCVRVYLMGFSNKI